MSVLYRPVQVEYLSDPEVDFGHCHSKCVNYENPNLNIGLPIFSIHGNHDDPSGHGGHSCLDLIHEAGLINYFGKVTDLTKILVRPILLRKAGVQVALYGLSNIKDERLHRLWRENRVEFELPGDSGDWFNILVLHQNRAKRGPTSYIPESFIPDFFHLVVWGHEHDCRIVPEASDKEFFITQPGSPCATSLCEGEAIQKKVGVLNIRADTKFKMDVIPLQTVRPLVFRTVALQDMRLDLGEPDGKKLGEAIERQLKYEVEEMLAEAELLLTGHHDQGKRPLLRLRVEYTDEGQMLNPSRFGNNYLDQVSNAADILLFKRPFSQRNPGVKDEKVDVEAMELLADSITMDDLVEEYFRNQEDDRKQMSVLSVKRMGAAVKNYINKDDKQGVEFLVTRQREKAYSLLLEREEGEDLDAFLVSQRSRTVEEGEEEEREAARMLDEPGRRRKGGVGTARGAELVDFPDDEEEGRAHDMSSSEEEAEEAPARGRGRGRAAARGRAKAPAKVPARGRAARGAASPAKPRGARGGRGGQSTIAAAFARSQVGEKFCRLEAVLFIAGESGDTSQRPEEPEVAEQEADV